MQARQVHGISGRANELMLRPVAPGACFLTDIMTEVCWFSLPEYFSLLVLASTSTPYSLERKEILQQVILGYCHTTTYSLLYSLRGREYCNKHTTSRRKESPQSPTPTVQRSPEGRAALEQR